MSDLIPVSIIGVVIGHSDGWDEMDTNAMMFYQFEPDSATGIEAGDLFVNYETGVFEVYKGDKITQTGELLEVLKNVT